MRLRRDVPVLVLEPGLVQIGIDPVSAVRVSELHPAAQEALLAADGGRTLTARPPLGVDKQVWSLLLDDLRTAGIAIDHIAPPLPAGQGEATVWEVLDPQFGRERVRARMTRKVGIIGLGPTGLTLAAGLAAAGVGTLILNDDAPVRSVDVGAAGYRWSDVGMPRTLAAARVIHDVAPGIATTDNGTDPDLVISVDQDVPDLVRAATLLVHGIRHLSIVVGFSQIVVGPLTQTTGPCLHCVYLHQSDDDPRWPQVVDATQAQPERPQRAESGPVSGVAGNLAAAWVLGELDGRKQSDGTAWKIPATDAIPRSWIWPIHPHCGCTHLRKNQPQ